VTAPDEAKERTISEWCRDFHTLFGHADTGRRTEEFWLATMAYCSSMGEAIRRMNHPDLLFSAAHTFCWICSFVTHISQLRPLESELLFHWPPGLSDTVFLKYPGLCGHCLSRPCKCASQEVDRKKNKGAHYRELLKYWKTYRKSDYTIHDWLSIFSDLYADRIHMMTLATIGFHFLEEAGEEAMGIRKLLQLRGVVNEEDCALAEEFLMRISTIEGLVNEYSEADIPRHKDTGKPRIDLTSRALPFVKARLLDAKMDLVIELADTFSWFCAILIKQKQLLEDSDLWTEACEFEQYLQKEYGAKGQPLKCYMCNGETCACLSFHGP